MSQMAIKTPGTPKAWMNTAVAAGLRAPGLRRLLGRSIALITVTGAVTGTRYTTPIQFQREGDELVFTSLRERRWWKNVERRPDVELLVAGELQHRVAQITTDREAPALLDRMLRRDPRLARSYGISLSDAGAPDPDGLAALADLVVVITVR